MKETAIIKKLNATLKDRFPNRIEKVILFGSRATKKTGNHSDYDILVIVKGPIHWRFEDEVLAVSYEIDLQYDVVTDIHLISHNDLKTIKGRQPYLVAAMDHGIPA